MKKEAIKNKSWIEQLLIKVLNIPPHLKLKPKIKRCLYCRILIRNKRSDAKFCSNTCRSKFAHSKKKQRKKSKQKKITYSKLTFILSVIGFIGSLGFYFGVLRQVYAKTNPNEIQQENENLKTQVNTLTRIVNECQNEK